MSIASNSATNFVNEDTRTLCGEASSTSQALQDAKIASSICSADSDSVTKTTSTSGHTSPSSKKRRRTDEKKKKDRLEANRHSAHESRERKKRRIVELEQSVAELNREHSTLAEEYDTLRRELSIKLQQEAILIQQQQHTLGTSGMTMAVPARGATTVNTSFLQSLTLQQINHVAPRRLQIFPLLYNRPLTSLPFRPTLSRKI